MQLSVAQDREKRRSETPERTLESHPRTSNRSTLSKRNKKENGETINKWKKTLKADDHSRV
eukprot:2824134-Amphidinium_carterae.1